MQLDLTGELQLCFHLVKLGNRLPLFITIMFKALLKSAKMKTLNSGVIILYNESGDKLSGKQDRPLAKPGSIDLKNGHQPI